MDLSFPGTPKAPGSISWSALSGDTRFTESQEELRDLYNLARLGQIRYEYLEKFDTGWLVYLGAHDPAPDSFAVEMDEVRRKRPTVSQGALSNTQRPRDDEEQARAECPAGETRTRIPPRSRDDAHNDPGGFRGGADWRDRWLRRISTRRVGQPAPSASGGPPLALTVIRSWPRPLRLCRSVRPRSGRELLRNQGN
jgi:hypothetical protein